MVAELPGLFPVPCCMGGSHSARERSVLRCRCYKRGAGFHASPSRVLTGCLPRHLRAGVPRAICTIVDRLRYSSHESLFEGSEGEGACHRRPPRHAQKKRDRPHARSLRAHHIRRYLRLRRETGSVAPKPPIPNALSRSARASSRGELCGTSSKSTMTALWRNIAGCGRESKGLRSLCLHHEPGDPQARFWKLKKRVWVPPNETKRRREKCLAR